MLPDQQYDHQGPEIGWWNCADCGDDCGGTCDIDCAVGCLIPPEFPTADATAAVQNAGRLLVRWTTRFFSDFTGVG